MSQQTPLVSMITKWLGVRRNKMWLRYKDDISPRTIPKPNPPPTSNAKLSANYYYTRDERRKAAPPMIVYTSFSTAAPRLEAGEKTESSKPEAPDAKETSPMEQFPTPGFRTSWTLSSDEPYLRN